VTTDAYPQVLFRALEQVGEGPYRFAELLEAFDVMTDEFCEHSDPRCSRGSVLDWLMAIGPQGQESLLRQINDKSDRASAA
jgi:hypothetical protein